YDPPSVTFLLLLFLFFFSFLMPLPPPTSTLFPYTTLFRSDALAQGLRVLVLVPEISLTPQLLERFARRLGVPLAVLHSQRDPERSEEHTSELQSRSDLVCRLLLEKKKKIKN